MPHDGSKRPMDPFEPATITVLVDKYNQIMIERETQPILVLNIPETLEIIEGLKEAVTLAKRRSKIREN